MAGHAAVIIAGTHWERNVSACASPPGAPVTQGESWPSLHRFGAMKENAGVAAARARSPGSGRNDKMCASQKAWFPVTDRKNVNPSWRAAYWSPLSAFWVWSAAEVAGWPHAGPRAVLTV